ncbi:DUF4349 domain-containing protein [Kineothrix sp. MB12-C1]|uniref:DUF4349 domain-containing protein n=1 Tax=Kineothrix sp. MB12-C1 TaxID=3070215 RepID=UPI0027D2D9A9|nr:DUF4349 domain-containing protein [Kineothrix sp. MB12-C1]WMC92394.1 DUF4349 domain-containing protein [Kineothrix sp. MB12-C1]
MITFKKKKWKHKLGMALVGVALLGFAGCGGSKSMTEGAVAPQEMASSSYGGYASDDLYMQGQESYQVEAEVTAEEAGTVEEAVVPSGRKLIKTVNLGVETEVFDELLPKVENKVTELGGYVENLNVYNGSLRYGQNSRSASLTIRIPKEKLDSFVTAVSDISNVISRSENVQDITLQYVDVESHKKALEVEQERLLELLGRAETMEDIVALEARLSEVRYQLQSMESQLRTYDNQIDYSTVYLNIEEVEVLTPPLAVSTWEKISTGFINSISNVGSGIKNFFIYFIIWLPYLIVWAIVILLIIVLIRFLIKKTKKKNTSVIQGNKGRPGYQGGPVHQVRSEYPGHQEHRQGYKGEDKREMKKETNGESKETNSENKSEE